MNWRTFLGGLVALIVAPILVLAGFAAYVHWINGKPQSGLLESSVRPQVLFPWQDAAYLLTFRGDKLAEERTAIPTLDIVLAVDVSGSMTSSLPAMAAAARQTVEELAASTPGHTRFALVRFDTQAEINTPWSGNPQDIFEGLKNLREFTGENDPRQVFLRMEELLAKARPEAKKVAVFYTDGYLNVCPREICPNPMSPAETVQMAQRLRARGLDLYAIGIPERGSSPLMLEITGSSEKVLDPADTRDLARRFREVMHKIVPSCGEGGQLWLYLDGRHFPASLKKTSWVPEKNGGLLLTVGRMPMTRTTYELQLEPQSSGLWVMGLESPRLTFTRIGGKRVEERGSYLPRLLVITWMALFLAALPAILWAVFNYPEKIMGPMESNRALPEIHRSRPPARLPALPAAKQARETPIPTLFIGLGATGRQALHAIRAELKEAHLGQEGQPYLFLWLDLDKHEGDQPTDFNGWDAYPVAPVLAPEEIRRAGQYLPQPGQEPLQWFKADRYHDTPREQLDLADGSHGDRALARLAWYRWLEQDESSLLASLIGKSRELVQMQSCDGTRQIVVAASQSGGTGSGWFLDLGCLLRRITRQLQQEGQCPFVPETIGILCDDTRNPRPANHYALSTEMASAALVGAYPQKLDYVPGHPLLDQVDNESPYNWILATQGPGAPAQASQASMLGAILVERYSRATLLEQVQVIGGTPPLLTTGRSLQVIPTLVQETVQIELLRRLLGPDILLDLDPSPSGGFSPRRIDLPTASKHLEKWWKDEPVGTPWHTILTAAVDDQAAAKLLALLQSSEAPTPEWFAQAFYSSLNQRLHGNREAADSTWRRSLSPGEAVATLRRLAQQLENAVNVLQAMGAAAEALETPRYISHLALTAATGLMTWMDEFCNVATEINQKRQELLGLPNQLLRLQDKTYLALPDEERHFDDLARVSLEKGLGTKDPTSAARERLFFAASAFGDEVRVRLQSYLNAPQNFNNAKEARDFLLDYCRDLAGIIPALRVSGALVPLADRDREFLACALVNSDLPAHCEVVVAIPHSDVPEIPETLVLEEFCQKIPQLAGQGTPQEVRSDDLSAIRRVQLWPSTAFIPPQDNRPQTFRFIALAECQAEALRQRLENSCQLSIPIFPPELRLALAQGEKFRSFARAYRAGCLERRADPAGRDQWFFPEQDRFLTFGANDSLAAAAANYVGVPELPQDFDQVKGGGDFSLLEEWRQKGGEPSGDVIVLAAIDGYERKSKPDDDGVAG